MLVSSEVDLERIFDLGLLAGDVERFDAAAAFCEGGIVGDGGFAGSGLPGDVVVAVVGETCYAGSVGVERVLSEEEDVEERLSGHLSGSDHKQSSEDVAAAAAAAAFVERVAAADDIQGVVVEGRCLAVEASLGAEDDEHSGDAAGGHSDDEVVAVGDEEVVQVTAEAVRDVVMARGVVAVDVVAQREAEDDEVSAELLDEDVVWDGDEREEVDGVSDAVALAVEATIFSEVVAVVETLEVFVGNRRNSLIGTSVLQEVVEDLFLVSYELSLVEVAAAFEVLVVPVSDFQHDLPYFAAVVGAPLCL